MKLARVVCVVAVLASTVCAQSSSKNAAILSGTVVDVTGAVIPGAKVTLKGHGNKATLTDEEGNFSFAGLQTGRYSLRVSRRAFKTTNRSGIGIEQPKRYDVRVVMNAAEIVDKIEFHDEPIRIDTKSSSSHNCVTDADMESLPTDRSIAGAVSAAGRCP